MIIVFLRQFSSLRVQKDSMLDLYSKAAQAAQGPDDVEQPPLSRKPTLGLFHGPGPTASSDLKAVGSLRGAVKEIEDELAEAFKKAVEAPRSSFLWPRGRFGRDPLWTQCSLNTRATWARG